MTATETSRLLAKQAEAVCKKLLPNGVLKDGRWCVGSISGDAGKSLQVELSGDKAGVWLDYADDSQKGDMIGLWKTVRGLSIEEATTEALEYLGIKQDATSHANPIPTHQPSEFWQHLQKKLRPGTPDELDALAALRDLPSVHGLHLATAAGHLWFADVREEGFDYPAWILTDESRLNAQARRMDGKIWEKDEVKCKTIKGCKASWPVGLAGVNGKNIAFVEGGPDLLAAWHYIGLRHLQDRFTPVAMFGTAMHLPKEAVPLFSGKSVCCFPHIDPDGGGEAAMTKWEKEAGVRFNRFDLKPFGKKDLNELLADPEKSDVAAKMFHVEQYAARPITSYAYPSDDDPNMLLGADDYLGRGGGLLFVSHAGAGKSSWAYDACMMWAIGKAWMGIKCHVPRKTLIVQAEDSDRYIGKIFTSFAHVNKLSPEELALLASHCVIIRLKGISGPAFFKALSDLCATHQPDLVVINPIYLYAVGDITRSEFAQPFLLGLDAVNREEKWAYILIHHTGKPAARDKSGKRPDIDDWESAYMGFGSSYLANWPRATILLEPVAGNPGHYLIKLGKGGYNAGIVKKVEQGVGFRPEPATRIAIRHSREKMEVSGHERPVYYWEMDDEAPAEDTKGKGGRPPKYQIGPYLRFIPATRELAAPAAQLHRAMGGASGIPGSSWADLLFRAANDGEIILTDVAGKGPCYHRKKEGE